MRWCRDIRVACEGEKVVALSAERVCARCRSADAERVRVAQVVHAHGHVVVLMVRTDRLETPALLVSILPHVKLSEHNLLGKINSLVILILRTSIHALVGVLLMLELVLLLLDRRRWRRKLLVSVKTTVGIHATESVGDHWAGSQVRRGGQWMVVRQAVGKAGRSSRLYICRARFRGFAELFCFLGGSGEQAEALGA